MQEDDTLKETGRHLQDDSLVEERREENGEPNIPGNTPRGAKTGTAQPLTQPPPICTFRYRPRSRRCTSVTRK